MPTPRPWSVFSGEGSVFDCVASMRVAVAAFVLGGKGLCRSRELACLLTLQPRCARWAAFGCGRVRGFSHLDSSAVK